jgi:hypothetical protein
MMEELQKFRSKGGMLYNRTAQDLRTSFARREIEK